MSGSTRIVATGGFDLPIPAVEAIGLLTPEGERHWVPGWDPTYPGGEASERPGTVFTTGETIWVIESLDRAATAATYSRVTPGLHAGQVRVRCEDLPDGRCQVTVEYDLTALSPDTDLNAYTEPRFSEMMRDWERLIAAILSEPS